MAIGLLRGVFGRRNPSPFVAGRVDDRDPVGVPSLEIDPGLVVGGPETVGAGLGLLLADGDADRQQVAGFVVGRVGRSRDRGPETRTAGGVASSGRPR
ncbi:hypothetical protein A6E15_07795 [Natrinema saccharevitans]|uniref:Uncharacterized protein n=1 Tax=Natrinema saccharevitans TaxID=301967 RepID=A0A1S8AWI0_9EURY|nr:hypothetical protein [Natrinema saccharevitans]OLZ40899.1 hypothetical protein A6E15_07795 [Natrinema saccharevitans]